MNLMNSAAPWVVTMTQPVQQWQSQAGADPAPQPQGEAAGVNDAFASISTLAPPVSSDADPGSDGDPGTDPAAAGQGGEPPPANDPTADGQQPPNPELNPDGSPKQPAPTSRGLLKRVDQLTSNWRNAQREADDLRVRLARYEQPQGGNGFTPQPASGQPQPSPTPSQPQPVAAQPGQVPVDANGAPIPPDPSRYAAGEFDPAFRAAERAYNKAEIAYQVRAANTADREQIQRDTAARTFEDRRSAFEAKITDADEGAIYVISGGLAPNGQPYPMTEAMADVIMDLPNGVKVLDHLGRNFTEAARIAALPAHKQGTELALLDAKFVPSAPTPAPNGQQQNALTPPAPNPNQVFSRKPAPQFQPGPTVGGRGQGTGSFDYARHGMGGQAEFEKHITDKYGGFRRR